MANSYALITGASSGIGYQYARVMAQKCYNLIIVSNQHDELEEKAEIIRKDFPSLRVVAYTINLAEQNSAKDLFEICKSNGFCVEVLINNAGVYHDKDFLDDSESFNSLILNLHVYTPSMLIYYFGKEMVDRKKGYILNMSSVTSNIAVQRLATYSATKAFLKNFSRSVHIELKDKGVYVTCVRPGAVATTLYNLDPSATKFGLMLGYIITPEKLARKGVNALFKGKYRITPGLSSHLLIFLIALIPTSVLRLVRRMKIF